MCEYGTNQFWGCTLYMRHICGSSATALESKLIANFRLTLFSLINYTKFQIWKAVLTRIQIWVKILRKKEERMKRERRCSSIEALKMSWVKLDFADVVVVVVHVISVSYFIIGRRQQQ